MLYNVTDKLAGKVLPQMYTVIDNVLEFLTVKLNINNKENIIISSWYRKPGSSIYICIDTLECIFRNTNKTRRYSCVVILTSIS